MLTNTPRGFQRSSRRSSRRKILLWETLSPVVLRMEADKLFCQRPHNKFLRMPRPATEPRNSGKDPLGCSSMGWVSWFSGLGCSPCPGFRLCVGASDCAPGPAFCFMGPCTFAWICCLQLPHHRGKTGTHSTCFYSTGGQTPRNGPTRNFHEKYRKNTPRPEIPDSQNLPPKYPENTEKIPPKYQKCAFLVFFRYFWGISWGSRISARGVFFWYFFVEIPARAISGLCSRSGHS